MTNKSKIQINFNNTYPRKSRKIFSILIVLFLITTSISTVVSSSEFLSDHIKKDINISN